MGFRMVPGTPVLRDWNSFRGIRSHSAIPVTLPCHAALMNHPGFEAFTPLELHDGLAHARHCLINIMFCNICNLEAICKCVHVPKA